MDNNIQELFSVPIGLKLVQVVDGLKLYSSENLKKSFLRSIKNSDSGKMYFSEFENLVNKGLVTPCYLNKSLFRLFYHKLFKGEEDKSIMGFYHIARKDVFILIDNSINPFGFASNDLLISTTLHECMHLSLGRNKNSFMKIFMNDFKKFYYSYFKQVFNLKAVPKNLENIINFISEFETKPQVNETKQLIIYRNLLQTSLKEYSDFDENTFEKTLNDYIVAMKIYLINFGTFIRIYRKYNHIFSPLDKSYKDTFGGKNTYTTPFQELICVSEVICVGSEIKPKNPKIKQALKLIK